MVQRLMPRHPWRPCQSNFLKNGSGHTTTLSPALIRHYFKSTQRPALLLLPPPTKTSINTNTNTNTRRIYGYFRLMSTLETQPSCEHFDGYGTISFCRHKVQLLTPLYSAFYCLLFCFVFVSHEEK